MWLPPSFKRYVIFIETTLLSPPPTHTHTHSAVGQDACPSSRPGQLHPEDAGLII